MVVIVFDLDDTLFDDLTYVRGGLRAVAKYLSPLLKLPSHDIETELNALLSTDRNQVFDRFLKEKGFYTKKLLQHCVSVYRKHTPQITLFPEAKRCLERFKDYPLYVVTDGNKLVQMRKFLALGLASRMKKCLCTYAYGLKHAKPSPYCFLKICEWEKVTPDQVIYVADNPRKDFVGIKPLGFHTVRVLKGPHRGYSASPSEQAEVVIPNLDELFLNLLH